MIAGAGIVGLCTAIWLQRMGQEVVVVDRGDPDLAASSGNAGVIARAEILPFATPQMARSAPGLLVTPGSPLSMRWAYLPRALPFLLAQLRFCTASHVETYVHAMAALTADSQAQHAALAQGTGAAGFLLTGDYCTGYATREAWQADRPALDLRARHGAEIETLDGAAFGALDSFYDGFFHTVVRMKAHGWIADPAGYLAALRAAFEQDGGTFVSAAITDVVSAPRPGLITSEGRIEGARLVLAMGAWSAPFARRLGLWRLRLESQRGYHLDLHNPDAMPAAPMKIPARGVVITPLRDRIRVAGLVEFGGLTAPPATRRFEQLQSVTDALFPSLGYSHVSRWMGHRPITTDSLPLIGPIDTDARTFAAFGHQHMGLTTGPVTGRMIASMITGREAPAIAKAFDPKRYR